MAAVDKAVAMMESLQNKVLADGEAEAKEMHEKIRGLEDVIKKINKDLEKEAKKNAKEVNTYEDSAADLSGAIEGITNAMK